MNPVVSPLNLTGCSIKGATPSIISCPVRVSAPSRSARVKLHTSAVGPEIATIATTVQTVVDHLATVAPTPLQPAVNVLGGDIASLAALSPTMPGLARLTGLYYLLLSKPSPFWGAIDYYIGGPLNQKVTTKFSSKDFFLRDKLGGGNFGITYEGVLLKNGDLGSISKLGPLTPEQKKRRVVLKKVNMDKSGVRSNFLKGGTMAKGAAETGEVEAYMCAKLKRNPVVARSVADFKGYFVVDEPVTGFTKGSQWLVWKFESDATLSDALDGALGQFPECLEEIVLGRRADNMGTEKREALVIKKVIQQILVGLKRLHSIGVVHRDVKPENLLVTADGEVKIIDFGAAVDMCTGVNFNPLYGMLDPRYCPPEELVMPRDFPRAPLPILAALLSPFAWIYGRPDLFDSYSVGVLLMQMAVPQLRSSNNIRQFNNDMRQFDYDLETWRQYRGSRYDFTQLDRNNEAGWDLAKKLLRPRNNINRGRLSVSQALRHRYFLPELF